MCDDFFFKCTININRSSHMLESINKTMHRLKLREKEREFCIHSENIKGMNDERDFFNSFKNTLLIYFCKCIKTRSNKLNSFAIPFSYYFANKNLPTIKTFLLSHAQHEFKSVANVQQAANSCIMSQ